MICVYMYMCAHVSISLSLSLYIYICFFVFAICFYIVGRFPLDTQLAEPGGFAKQPWCGFGQADARRSHKHLQHYICTERSNCAPWPPVAPKAATYTICIYINIYRHVHDPGRLSLTRMMHGWLRPIIPPGGWDRELQICDSGHVR